MQCTTIVGELTSITIFLVSQIVDLSWDIAEAIWLHSVSKQLLPGNLPVLVSSRWPHLSHMLEILCDDRRGDGGGCEGEDGAGVLMEHVLEVLGGSSVEGVVRGDGAEPESGGVARSEWEPGEGVVVWCDFHHCRVTQNHVSVGGVRSAGPAPPAGGGQNGQLSCVTCLIHSESATRCSVNCRMEWRLKHVLYVRLVSIPSFPSRPLCDP